MASLSSTSAAVVEIAKHAPFDQDLLDPLRLDVGDEGSPQIKRFIEEFEKLQRVLRTSHDSVIRWEGKCKAQSYEIRDLEKKLLMKQGEYKDYVANKNKYREQIELNLSDKENTTAELKEKQELIAKLTKENAELDIALNEGESDAIKAQKNKLLAHQVEFTRLTEQSDAQNSALAKAHAKNIELSKMQQDSKAELRKCEQDIEQLDRKIMESRAQAGKDLRRKENVERELEDLQQQLAQAQEMIVRRKEDLVRAKKELSDSVVRTDKSEEEWEQHRARFEQCDEEQQQLMLELEENKAIFDAAYRSLRKTKAEAKDISDSVANAAVQAKKKKAQLEAMSEQMMALQAEKTAIEREKARKTERKIALQEALNALKIKNHNTEKSIDTCLREREVLSQHHSLKIDSIKKKDTALKIKRSTLKNIKNEHQGYLISIRNTTKAMDKLKRDKALHEVDLQRKKAQKARALEEVAEREAKIAEYQAEIVANESRYRQQQNMLEAVRSDRSVYLAQQIELQNDITEHKRKFANLDLQITQLKNENSEKDITFVTEHFNLEHVRADIFQLQSVSKTTQAKLNTMDEVIKDQAVQVRKLSTIIADADEELRVQKKQYMAVLNEQGVLNQQLIARNEELAKLYEELKLQNSLLTKSQTKYTDTVLLLKGLKFTEEELAEQLDDVTADCDKYEELKDMIAHFQRKLVEEKLRTKALSDELKKPINVHRWRRLQDTDSESYAMVKRVRQLQKAIIKRTAAVEAKDKVVQEKEKLYVELRKVLARQPGNEATEQLRMYRATLREKSSKFKTMKSELKMYQTKVYEFKYDIQKLQDDMNVIKLAYFAKMRREGRRQRNQFSRGGFDSRGSYGSVHSRQNEFAPQSRDGFRMQAEQDEDLVTRKVEQADTNDAGLYDDTAEGKRQQQANIDEYDLKTRVVGDNQEEEQYYDAEESKFADMDNGDGGMQFP